MLIHSQGRGRSRGQKWVVDDVIRTRARFRTNLAGWLLNHSDTSTET